MGRQWLTHLDVESHSTFSTLEPTYYVFAYENVGSHPTISPHGHRENKFLLLIWLNENILKMPQQKAFSLR
jgi:hypothetical protein